MAGSGSETFSLGEVLALHAMRGARLVAGRRGIDNAVEGVGVLDVTDPDSIQANQLVLSSVYPLQGVDLDGLVRTLAAAGSSALGLKLLGYWADVPDELVEASDFQGLPLLVLPEGPFDEMVNPILAAIAGRQAGRLRRSADLHSALTRAALSEHEEPGGVVEVLAATLRHPCAIFDDRGEMVAGTGDEGVWNREKLAELVLEAREPGPIELDDERYFVTPIPGARPSVGAVCVHGDDVTGSFARAAIAHAAVVAGMLLVGRRQIRVIHRRFERELMEDLVERRIRQPREARWRAGATGWPVRRPYLAAVAGWVEGGAGAAEAALDLDEAFLSTLRRQLLGLGREVRLFVRRPGLGIVVHLRPDDDQRAVGAHLGELLTDRVEQLAAGDLGIGVAEPRREVTDLADAFREAALAFSLSILAGAPPPRVAHFADLGAFRLLARVSDRRHLRGTAWSLLEPLNDPSLPRRAELVETLASLLRHNMNLTATSGAMFFHYNTIRHRLSTLQRLLGPSLDRPEDRLSLSLALSALRLLHVDESLQSRTVEARPLSTGWTSLAPD